MNGQQLGLLGVKENVDRLSEIVKRFVYNFVQNACTMYMHKISMVGYIILQGFINKSAKLCV